MLNTDNSLETRRKKLLFRSWHRGVKETDLVLGTFAERELGNMDSAALDLFEALLEESDADIWDWLVEKCPAPREDYHPLLAQLRHYRALA